MCLPVSRLFWVSSLAYPNLLGTKGYIVVVVAAVVVVLLCLCTSSSGSVEEANLNKLSIYGISNFWFCLD
jgi:hypothetical protein